MMTKKENRLAKLVFLLLGILIGFLLSPVKKGQYFSIGNVGNGNIFCGAEEKKKRKFPPKDVQ